MDSQSEYESSHGDDGGGKPSSIEERDRLNKLDEEPEYDEDDENNNLIDPSFAYQAIDDSQSEYESSHWTDGTCEEEKNEEPEKEISLPVKNICQARGCTEVAIYGKIDEDTREFKRCHCKKHRKDEEKGNPPPLKDRHDYVSNIYSNKGFDLVIKDKKIWKEKCTGNTYKPSCTCQKCRKIIENPTSIDKMKRQGLRCPYCVENERKQQQNGRPHNQGHPCDGRCGTKDCNKSFIKSSHLKEHQEAHLKKYTCPVPNCPKHNDGYGKKSDIYSHFRKKHKDLCESDGSCPQYEIPPKGTSHLRKPEKYDEKITNAEWRFLKQLIDTCIRNDIARKHRWTPEDQEYLKEINTNEYKHQFTEEIVDILLERNMIKGPCIDDAGGCLPNGFVLDHHSLDTLSLDRKDNDRQHFLPNTENILENLSLVPIGMNTSTNIVAIHTENTCDYVRKKVKESQQKTKEDEYNLLPSQSKKYNKIRGRRTQSTLYRSSSSVFNGKFRSGKNKGEYIDKECREKFETVDNLFKYCYSLLEKQRGYCDISGIFLENETSESHSPFKLSVDAIKPGLGHVPGNIRIICQFLNSTNTDKTKTYVAEDDRETAWTPELFKEYFQIPE